MNITLKNQGQARAGLYESLEEQYPDYFVSKHTPDGTIEMTPRQINPDLKALLNALVKKGLITKQEVNEEKQE
jgi:hypothetical protein